MGAAIVEGAMRGTDGGSSGGGYLKLIVAVKHATAYQIENNRFARNVNIPPHDLSCVSPPPPTARGRRATN